MPPPPRHPSRPSTIPRDPRRRRRRRHRRDHDVDASRRPPSPSWDAAPPNTRPPHFCPLPPICDVSIPTPTSVRADLPTNRPRAAPRPKSACRGVGRSTRRIPAPPRPRPRDRRSGSRPGRGTAGDGTAMEGGRCVRPDPRGTISTTMMPSRRRRRRPGRCRAWWWWSRNDDCRERRGRRMRRRRRCSVPRGDGRDPWRHHHDRRRRSCHHHHRRRRGRRGRRSMRKDRLPAPLRIWGGRCRTARSSSSLFGYRHGPLLRLFSRPRIGCAGQLPTRLNFALFGCLWSVWELPADNWTELLHLCLGAR